MKSTSGDTDVCQLLREAAQWRLISLLLECPVDGWHDQLAGLAAEVGDAPLREAVDRAREEASQGLYHTAFGPGGPSPPRELSYRDTVHPGRFLAEIRDCYHAFAYTPNTPEAPDHVATEAGFIAYLRLKEAYARACGEREKGDRPNLPQRPATNLRSVPGCAQIGPVPFFAAEAAAVCHCAAERFLEEHLSIIAQPLAQSLEASGIGYLERTGAALLDRVGPSRGGSPVHGAPFEPIQSACGSDHSACGSDDPESGLRPDGMND